MFCIQSSTLFYFRFLFLYYREIVEVSIAPKPQKLSAADHGQLTDLLLSKDAELKKTLELADEQAKIQQKMNELKAEVDNKVSTYHVTLKFTGFIYSPLLCKG